MKFLAVTIVLLVAQGIFAHPHPDPSLSSFISTAASGLSGIVTTAGNTVNTLVGTGINSATAAETAVLNTIQTAVPGVSNLVGTVSNVTKAVTSLQPLTLLSDVTAIVTAVKSGSTANVINTVLDLIGTSDVLNNTVIQLPVKANDTSVGDFFNAISGALTKANTAIENAVTLVNQTFTDITSAAENFVTNGIGSLNPAKGSACWTAVNQAKQNFVQTVADNAKVCVYNIINLVSNDLNLINSIQTEINNVIQTGSLRLSLLDEIFTASVSIPIDISGITVTFPTCVSTQLAKSLLALQPIVTGSLFTCRLNFAIIE